MLLIWLFICREEKSDVPSQTFVEESDTQDEEAKKVEFSNLLKLSLIIYWSNVIKYGLTNYNTNFCDLSTNHAI